MTRGARSTFACQTVPIVTDPDPERGRSGSRDAGCRRENPGAGGNSATIKIDVISGSEDVVELINRPAGPVEGAVEKGKV
jgi:hypothetical protein